MIDLSNVIHKILSDQKEKISANLIYVSKAKYEEDWHSTLHSHPFTELFYVVKGSGSFLIHNKTYPVREDDLVIVNANVPHTESSKDSNPLEYIVLGIEGMSITLNPQKEGVAPSLHSIHNYHEHRGEILHYLDSLVNEAERKEEYYDTISQNLLNILLLNVVRKTKSDLVISAQKATNKDCTYIKGYIDIHYREDLTLDQLAKETYLDKFYLVHMYKRQFGISPIQYLIEKRLKEAMHLLETTNYSIAEISNIVGFNSQSYFNQIFKKKIGVTPGTHRKNSGKQVCL